MAIKLNVKFTGNNFPAYLRGRIMEVYVTNVAPITDGLTDFGVQHGQQWVVAESNGNAYMGYDIESVEESPETPSETPVNEVNKGSLHTLVGGNPLKITIDWSK